jgi:hypothetical protein
LKRDIYISNEQTNIYINLDRYEKHPDNLVYEFESMSILRICHTVQDKRLINGAIDSISEIIWLFFRRAQLYDQDLPPVKRNSRSSNRCDDCRISSEI